MLYLIVGIIAAIVTNTTKCYNMAIVGFLADGLILTSSSADGLLYTSNRANQAAAAGFTVLTTVHV